MTRPRALVPMIDRRLSLKASLGAIAALGFRQHPPETLGDGDRVVVPQFRRGQVLSACRIQPLDPTLLCDVRERVVRYVRWRNKERLTRLTMPEAKFRFLVGTMRHITYIYGRPDLFVPWAERLVWREEFGATASCGFGLGHQFQDRQGYSGLRQDADWWAFLIPPGISYQALDGKPVYLVVVAVLGEPGIEKDYRIWSIAERIPKFLDARKTARSQTSTARRELNRALVRAAHDAQ